MADAPDFESALQELLALAQEEQQAPEQARAVEKAGAAPRRPARYWMPEVGAAPEGLPYIPPMPARNVLSGEMRSSLSPEVDTVMGVTGLPTAVGPWLDTIYRLGSAGPRQVQRAEGAIDKAIDDPSVATIANAGTQTGMAAMRPAIALPSVAVQYGDALARDLGLFGGGEAQAQSPLTRGQQRQMEIERQRAARDAELRRGASETDSRLRREEEDARRRGEVETEAARKDRAEYDRAVGRAEEVRQTELDKRRTFRDTNVGKAWEETGGVAPFLLGVGSGFVQRGIDPNVSHRAVMGLGALGGAAASNLPLGADAYLVPPVENPDKRAFEGYARELPPTHPRKQEFQDYAAGLPGLNPARSEAQKEFFDTESALKRNAFGAAEGLAGSEFGYGAWHIPARLFNALGRGAQALTSRPPPQGPPPGTSGGGGGGTPGANILSGEPTAVRALNGPTPIAPSGSPAPSPDQLLAPASLPNLAASEARVFTKSKGKDGVTRFHDGDTGHFTGNPRRRLDE